MEPIELSRQERSKLCELLHYCMETNANCNQNFKGDWDAGCFEEEQNEMRALIQKLEYKPVQREGWMNIYGHNRIPRYGAVHNTQQEALDIGADPRNRRWGAPVQCVRVTWEE